MSDNIPCDVYILKFHGMVEYCVLLLWRDDKSIIYSCVESAQFCSLLQQTNNFLPKINKVFWNPIWQNLNVRFWTHFLLKMILSMQWAEKNAIKERFYILRKIVKNEKCWSKSNLHPLPHQKMFPFLKIKGFFKK